jgi:hypothetical protein
MLGKPCEHLCPVPRPADHRGDHHTVFGGQKFSRDMIATLLGPWLIFRQTTASSTQLA